MAFAYENQGHTTYLTYDISPSDVIDTMSIGMMTNNKIHGLAPAVFTQMDTTKYLKYNVTAKIPVKQFFTGPVNKKRLVGVFSGIIDAMLSSEEYMINPDSLLLDLDYIFADVSTCETVMICLPIEEVEQQHTDLGTFFKNIVFSTQFDQTENCDYVTKIINYLNSSPIFSMVDFKAVLDEIAKGGNAAPAAPAYAQQQRVQPPQPQVNANPIPNPVSAAPMGQPAPMQPPVKQPAPQPQPQVKPQGAPIPPMNNVPPMQPNKQGNMAVPPMNQPPMGQPQQPAAQNGEKMSFFYLMQHYNKENAAIYKAQKDAAKNGGMAPGQPPMAPPMNMGAAPGQPTPPPAGAPKGFAIPGQPTPPPAGAPKGFAIPGQPTPPPAGAPKGFAIPGQPTPPPTGAPNGFAIPGQRPAPMQTPAKQPAPAPNVPPMQPQMQPPMGQQPIAPAFNPQAAPQVKPMSFGETTVLGGGGGFGETTVLGGGAPMMTEKPHLLRTKNNEKINLDKPVFRIGKEKSYVDYFIGDNTAISRSHANFITRDGEYFVVDTNSTNHTFVNGAMIQSNVETRITHGTKIRLANEEFEFKLY